MSVEQSQTTADLVPATQPPSFTRNRSTPFNETDLEWLNRRIKQKPDRSWPSQHTNSESSTPTPNVTPIFIDPVERFRGDAIFAGALLWDQKKRADGRMTIDTADYWMKETLHYRHVLEENQNNIKDGLSYWKEEARHMLQALRDHAIPACKRQDIRYGINDADYWKEEAQHLDNIYYGRGKEIPKASKVLDLDNEAHEVDTESKSSEPQIPKHSTKAGVTKHRKQGSTHQPQTDHASIKALMRDLAKQPFARWGAGRRSKLRRPVKDTLSDAVPNQPISSRFRSGG